MTLSTVLVANRSAAEGGPATARASPAISILGALQRAGVDVRHDCGGKALCGTCRFRVLKGASALSPILPREEERLAAVGEETADGALRLACQAHAFRDIEIELSL
ncbi:MAG TPA: 2Fe-2S iron-sulfur cluster-binding protein [Rectinemataceae bacterium]|nr:2Fe-2S iron-sulfur cluster-binding protein [Rectinemataceae bacterium]